VTSSAVGCYRQVFSEVDPRQDVIVEDAAFVQDHSRLITFTLAHVIGEESAFVVRES